MNYQVVWIIDVEASSAREAAEQARAHQIRYGTTATVFDVTPRGGRTRRIDLDAPQRKRRKA